MEKWCAFFLSLYEIVVWGYSCIQPDTKDQSSYLVVVEEYSHIWGCQLSCEDVHHKYDDCDLERLNWTKPVPVGCSHLGFDSKRGLPEITQLSHHRTVR